MSLWVSVVCVYMCSMCICVVCVYMYIYIFLENLKLKSLSCISSSREHYYAIDSSPNHVRCAKSAKLLSDISPSTVLSKTV